MPAETQHLNLKPEKRGISMWIDRLGPRLQATIILSVALHFLVLTQVGFRRAAQRGSTMVLTDVQYVQDDAGTMSETAVPAKAAHPRRPENQDDSPSTQPAQPQAETQPAENPAGGVPFDPNVDGKLFMPFYAVEEVPLFQTKITPVYPESAQKLGLTAKVILEAYIGADGRVRMARIVKSGGDLFDQAALQALRHSTFLPARVNGKPVPVRILVPYVFSVKS